MKATILISVLQENDEYSSTIAYIHTLIEVTGTWDYIIAVVVEQSERTAIELQTSSEVVNMEAVLTAAKRQSKKEGSCS